MKIKEAIILAGGLGTRLRSAVPDLPKSMAFVAGRPFISYIIDYLRMQGIERFVFSLGYKSDVILEYLDDKYPTLDYAYVIEDEPLGTGGGLKLAFNESISDAILIANGDTIFKIDLAELVTFHAEKKSECTIALKKMTNIDRYGVVELADDGIIKSFKEKQYYSEGLINGGVYLVDKQKFSSRTYPAKFSFEKDYLEKYSNQKSFYGFIQNGYFIDIGVPEDYLKAQEDLAASNLDIKKVDSDWTLFLDRDGVINNERLGKYVLNWNEFIFSTGVLEAFKLLSNKFKRILIVSNQRGVSKALMTEDDLNHIHQEMIKEVNEVGGHIDKIYYCTNKEDKHPGRKPNPGMAFQAKRDYSDLDFNKAIMVGNKPSDMRFGRAAGMFTVFLTTTNPDQPFPHPDIDAIFTSLLEFAQALES